MYECTAPDELYIGLLKLTYISIIYNLKISITRVPVKMRKLHHAIHALESVAYI